MIEIIDLVKVTYKNGDELYLPVTMGEYVIPARWAPKVDG